MFVFIILSLKIVFTKDPPKIDGNLNEPSWRNVKFYSNFRQFRPAVGAKPTEKTEVGFIYTAQGLFIGFRCFDSQPEHIVKRKTRRDEYIETDNVCVDIDSYNEERDAYWFKISAGNCKEDGHFSSSNYNKDWDGKWKAEVSFDSLGWYAEYKIPFKTLRFEKEGDSLKFGVHISREIFYKNERVELPLITEEVQNEFSEYLPLIGLKLSKIKTSKKKLELAPYGRISYQDDLKVREGLNIKYYLKSNLIIDAAINPDFGQVESDPAQLNLSTYEAYLPEKRPFFIEGSDIFSTGLELFYSRRIGDLPYFYPHPGESLISKPQDASILGAGKLTGKVSDNEYGILLAATDREVAVVDSSGTRIKREIVPKRYYGILRYKRNIGNNSSIGFLETVRKSHNINDEEYAGLVDWDFNIGKNTMINGEISASDVDNLLYAFNTGIDYNFPHGSIAIGYEEIQDGYDINGVGYLYRDNIRELNSNLYLYTEKPQWIFKSVNLLTHFYLNWNQQGYSLGHGFSPYLLIDFQNGMGVDLGGHYKFSGYNDRVTRGGPPLKKPFVHSHSLGFHTDLTNDHYLTASINNSHSEYSDYRNLVLAITLNLFDFLSFKLSPSYGNYENKIKWIANEYFKDSTNYTFGTLKRDIKRVSLRVNYIPRKNLSFQLWTESYITTGDYSDFKKLVNPNMPSFSEIKINYNPDFMMEALRLHFVLRWEYIPDSELFLVCTKEFDNYKSVTPTSSSWMELPALYSEPGEETYLFKISIKKCF